MPAVEPNAAPTRPDASDQAKTAPVEKPKDKTPPVIEPNIPINSTDFFRQSIAADADIGADPNAAPVYHFIAQSPVRHFCTINEQEKYKLIDEQSDTWKYAGIAFFAYPEGLQPRGARPVFRFWSPSLWRHFFTLNEAEKKLLTKDFTHLWEYQGVAWYIPPAKPQEKK